MKDRRLPLALRAGMWKPNPAVLAIALALLLSIYAPEALITSVAWVHETDYLVKDLPVDVAVCEVFAAQPVLLCAVPLSLCLTARKTPSLRVLQLERGRRVPDTTIVAGTFLAATLHALLFTAICIAGVSALALLFCPLTIESSIAAELIREGAPLVPDASLATSLLGIARIFLGPLFAGLASCALLIATGSPIAATLLFPALELLVPYASDFIAMLLGDYDALYCIQIAIDAAIHGTYDYSSGTAYMQAIAFQAGAGLVYLALPIALVTFAPAGRLKGWCRK